MDSTPRAEKAETARDPAPPRHRKVRRMLGRACLALGSLTVLGALSVVAVVWWYGRAADNIDPRVLLDYNPPQVTHVLARDGTLIGELHSGERRRVVPYDALPDQLVLAFLAAEDADFFEHDGLDWPGIARAITHNLRKGHRREGASTITQQVVKNTLLTRARTIERKSQEVVLAGRVEAVLTKAQILEIYVNEIYFGEGRYGVAEAARYYFGKQLDELDLGEMATLAALPNAPGVVTCYRRRERLEARRDYVLEQMVEHGFADASAARRFIGRPIQALDQGQSWRGLGEADEFVELARAELIARYGEDALATLGATVTTSVDLDVQIAARAAGRRELDALEARHGYGAHARPLSPRARARLDARAPAKLETGARYQVVVAAAERRAQVGRVRATLGEHELEIETEGLGLSEAELAERFTPGHAIAVRVVAPARDGGPARARLEPGPELAVAVADLRSGELLALIGGRSFQRGEFDRARLAHRQPGSAFKPVVYGAALRAGAFTAASLVPGDAEGEPISLREALAQSDNAVALALMEAVGPERVHAFARDLGLVSALGDEPSLALGTSELTPLELLTAYLTLGRGGVGVEPSAILTIEAPADLQGPEVPLPQPEPRARAFGVEPEIAAALTDMLQAAVEDGTGQGARALGRPVAAKTGTTDEARDAWVAGYTSEHAAVAWVGFDVPQSLGRNESGSSLAMQIWLAAIEAATSDSAQDRP
ncbi:Penicillin-binding protein 1A [Enhygromyxa salina]|uniref:Penicillin-binding protein 1A n=1 Tax=Enhygromyxa salina TaxID=215803 RepID=A0A2S9XJZ0_9BACT|nr:transglycosylase domain-containing protein [Enhygromyxa salina]PRP93194.1 Penicillin-binding protein 1A [Enhygromyxa salina]